MKPARMLLILLIIILVGCSQVYVPVVSAPDCHVPDKPVYTKLEPQEHLASTINVERLMLIISDMSAYTKRLEATIKCFSPEE